MSAPKKAMCTNRFSAFFVRAEPAQRLFAQVVARGGECDGVDLDARDAGFLERKERFCLIGTADYACDMHLLQIGHGAMQFFRGFRRSEREDVTMRLKLLLDLLKQFRIVEVGQPGKNGSDDVGTVPPQHLPGQIQPVPRIFRQLPHGFPHFRRNSRRSLQRHRHCRLGDVEGFCQLPLCHVSLCVCLSVLIIR